jgi:iron complex transport system substrate-binding protein
MNKLLRVLSILLVLSTTASASRVVRDELGRDIAVPDHPHRLICLAPSITDTVYALGRGDDVVGITDYTKYPPEAKQKPSVGGVINPSLEMLVSMRPDLVLAIGDLNSSDLVRSIEHLGIPVFAIYPHGVEGIYRSIGSIGKAINQEAQASALVERLQERERAVRQRVAGKKTPTVLFVMWTDPIITAGRGAFITELIDIAGGKSVSDDLPNEWPRVSFDTIIARQPEYLLLERGSPASLETLQQQAAWRRLGAVKERKVFYADDRIDFPSPLAFDALEDLAKQFHP